MIIRYDAATNEIRQLKSTQTCLSYWDKIGSLSEECGSEEEIMIGLLNWLKSHGYTVRVSDDINGYLVRDYCKESEMFRMVVKDLI